MAGMSDSDFKSYYGLSLDEAKAKIADIKNKRLNAWSEIITYIALKRAFAITEAEFESNKKNMTNKERIEWRIKNSRSQ